MLEAEELLYIAAGYGTVEQVKWICQFGEYRSAY
jgi:hypothetical protein